MECYKYLSLESDYYLRANFRPFLESCTNKSEVRILGKILDKDVHKYELNRKDYRYNAIFSRLTPQLCIRYNYFELFKCLLKNIHANCHFKHLLDMLCSKKWCGREKFTAYLIEVTTCKISEGDILKMVYSHNFEALD